MVGSGLFDKLRSVRAPVWLTVLLITIATLAGWRLTSQHAAPVDIAAAGRAHNLAIAETQAADVAIKGPSNRQPAAKATLHVSVRALEDDQPLPAVVIALTNRDFGIKCESMIAHSLLARSETRLTAPAALDVPPSTQLFLMVMRAGAQTTEWAQPFQQLESGEVRELQVHIPKVPRRLYGKIIDARTRSPIRGARVTVLTARGRGLDCAGPLSDRDGRFQLPLLAEDQEASVHAVGYNALDFALPAQPTPRERPLSLPLTRSGMLAVRVSNADGSAAADATVGVTAEPESSTAQHEALTWFAQTDASGRSQLDLPAGAALTLTIHQKKVQRWHSTVPRLAPAERRTVSVQLPAPLILRGTLVDQNAEPVPTGKVWLARAGSSQRPDPSRWRHPPLVREVAVSGTLGEFSFAEVLPGFWYVGPGTTPIAATTQVVQVVPAVPPPDITVTAYPNLFISGRIVAQDENASLDGISIVAGEGAERVYATSQSDGRFRLGPLWPAAFEVVAHRDTTASSPTVLATPGDAELDLTLLPQNSVSGTLRVQIIATDGGPLGQAYVMVNSATTSTDYFTVNGATGSGRVSFSGLPAGEYTLTAGDVAGLATARAMVTPGHVNDLRMQLQPSAIIELAGGSLDQARMGVRDTNGIDACEVSVVFQPQRICVLPPGHFTVTLEDGSGHITSHEIDVTAAERYRFRLPDP